MSVAQERELARFSKRLGELLELTSLKTESEEEEQRNWLDDEFDALKQIDRETKNNLNEFATSTLGTNLSKNRFDSVWANEATLVRLRPRLSHLEYLNSGSNSRNDNNNNNQSESSINRTRVQFNTFVPQSIKANDYINANYIDARNTFHVPFLYIATQSPLPNTVNDFWQMVYNHNVQSILMLCNEVENEQVKSEKYWPNVHETRLYGLLTVRSLSEIIIGSVVHRQLLIRPAKEINQYYTNRNLTNRHTEDERFSEVEISNSCTNIASSRDNNTLKMPTYEVERVVQHLQYTTWPHQSVPWTSAPLSYMMHRIGSGMSSAESPIVVHCSGGLGRSGVFIAMHMALAQFELEQFPISVFEIVCFLKHARTGMVQNREQYLFIYFALKREMQRLVILARNNTSVTGEQSELKWLERLCATSQSSLAYSNLSFERGQWLESASATSATKATAAEAMARSSTTNILTLPLLHLSELPSVATPQSQSLLVNKMTLPVATSRAKTFTSSHSILSSTPHTNLTHNSTHRTTLKDDNYKNCNSKNYNDGSGHNTNTIAKCNLSLPRRSFHFSAPTLMPLPRNHHYNFTQVTNLYRKREKKSLKEVLSRLFERSWRWKKNKHQITEDITSCKRHGELKNEESQTSSKQENKGGNQEDICIAATNNEVKLSEKHNNHTCTLHSHSHKHSLSLNKEDICINNNNITVETSKEFDTVKNNINTSSPESLRHANSLSTLHSLPTLFSSVLPAGDTHGIATVVASDHNKNICSSSNGSNSNRKKEENVNNSNQINYNCIERSNSVPVRQQIEEYALEETTKCQKNKEEEAIALSGNAKSTSIKHEPILEENNEIEERILHQCDTKLTNAQEDKKKHALERVSSAFGEHSYNSDNQHLTKIIHASVNATISRQVCPTVSEKSKSNVDNSSSSSIVDCWMSEYQSNYKILQESVDKLHYVNSRETSNRDSITDKSYEANVKIFDNCPVEHHTNNAKKGRHILTQAEIALL